LFFLVATGVSIATSVDVSRSLRLSVPWVPALLLFFLMTFYGRDTRYLRGVFLVLSLVSLGLASALLWTAWKNPQASPSVWVTALGSPLLLVPNDVTFLAVTAPLSLVLLYRQPRSAVGVGAACSLLLSLAAICVFRSRVALGTLVITLLIVTLLFRPRLALVWGMITLCVVLGIESVLGFPLFAKFAYWPDSRIALWLSAWSMFCDAPVLGHGPHTFVLLYQSYLREVHIPWWLPVDARVVPWAHSLYLETLAEQGILGLVSLGILLGQGIAVGRQTQRAPPGDSRLLGAGALAGLCGLGLAGLIELSFLRQWVVVMLCTLLGVLACLSSSDSHSQIQKEKERI
jgi:O-antigen ligase